MTGEYLKFTISPPIHGDTLPSVEWIQFSYLRCKCVPSEPCTRTGSRQRSIFWVLHKSLFGLSRYHFQSYDLLRILNCTCTLVLKSCEVMQWNAETENSPRVGNGSFGVLSVSRTAACSGVQSGGEPCRDSELS
jgi:hypothetical protein